MKLPLTFIALLFGTLWLINCIEGFDAIQSVEIHVDGELTDPDALEVIFENQSGHTVELYWDDGEDGEFQGSIDHDQEISLNTYLGHRFYYTTSNSSGSKQNILYTVIIEQDALVTLYDPETMKQRGVEFERQKSLWMKEYFKRTGRTWRNYYPRDPVIHHYYDVKQTGEIVKAATDRTQFNICGSSDLTEADIAELDEMESEISENDKFYFGRVNETTYCREKVKDKHEIEIHNICAYGPHAFQISNFLSEDEMEHIKILGQSFGLKRSTVSPSDEALESEVRTSQTVWIKRKDSFIVDNIIRRIADTVLIAEDRLYSNASSEELQLVHYFGGELYESHVDYGVDIPHNRYVTFLMYLNDVEQGGNTSFSVADKRCMDHNGYFGVRPIKGSAMFFYNLFPDGNVDPKTEHFAEPPVDCEKWMTNLWIWDKVFT